MNAAEAMIALTFRPMCETDLEAVVAEERHICAFPWTAGNFRDSLAAGYSAWLARDRERLATYAVMMIALDEAQLLTIGVAAVYQRQGYGGAMLEHLYGVARSCGGQRMLLEVRESNVAARTLYVRHGFEQIGLRRRYYPALAGREDAIVMVRAL